jgi:CBS domain-containing protein
MNDAMSAGPCAAPSAAGLRAPVLLGFTDADLKVCDIMTDHVVCVVPAETVLAAVRRMSECRVSCVIVVEGETVAGILTERDVLRGVAAGRRDPTKAKVAEKMSHPVVSIRPESPVLEAGIIMRSKGVRRLAVVDGPQLLGLVTQTDITRGLISLWPYKEVADIMSPEVVTADASATVAQAAGLMSSRNISCVVVMRHQDAVGILTEKDVLKRVVALHRDPGATPVADVMSRPIVALPPAHSIMCASRIMDRMRIHRLVVKENKQVCGIVSQTDILDAVRRELEQIRETQLCREAEVRQLMESAARSLSSMESLVREASGICAPPGAPGVRTGKGGHASCDSPASTSPGHRPARALSSIVISLQDLIAESRSNLHRLCGLVQRPRVLRGDSDSTDRPTHPGRYPDATCSAESRPQHCPAGTNRGPAGP